MPETRQSDVHMIPKRHTIGVNPALCGCTTAPFTSSRLTNLDSGWNRLANLVVGNSLAKDVVASAKFYAQLNYALANAAIASWDSK